MMKTTSSVVVIEHESHEENLASAKRSVRTRRGACLNRIVSGVEDVIEVLVGCDVVERHVCHEGFGCSERPSSPIEDFRVEDLALYQ